MAETKTELVEWLDDLCVRFIINLPQEELESVERICFQVEEAQWFYEDFVRPLNPSLPSMNLREFCLLIFKHCPLLSAFSSELHAAAFSEFLAYKTRVPVRGAILLNNAMDKVLLVKGWKKGSNWSFPRGKINKDENDLDCTIREVYEETGYDIRAAGLVKDDSEMKFIDITMREQHILLYVFRGVPEDTQFKPRTRKEISKIDWFKLSELPTYKKSSKQTEGYGEDLVRNNKFYMVAPFLVPLKKWIAQQRRNDAKRTSTGSKLATVHLVDDTMDGTLAASKEEAEAKARLEVQSDDDLDNLLASLRRSHTIARNGALRETVAPIPQSDVADKLKRLLSVGSAADPVQLPSTSATSKVDALFEMLRGRAQQPLGLGGRQGPQPPETPAAQIDQTLATAPPQYHQPRVQSTSHFPPRLSPVSLPFHHHVPKAYHPSEQAPTTRLTQDASRGYGPLSPGFESQLPNKSHLAQEFSSGYGPLSPGFESQLPPNPRLVPSPPRGHAPLSPGFESQLPKDMRAQHFETSSQSNAESSGQHIRQRVPRFYQRPTDGEPAQAAQTTLFQTSIIPSASQLPPPKLTDHAMNLLKAFKASGEPMSSSTRVAQPAPTAFADNLHEGLAIVDAQSIPTNALESTRSTATAQLPVLHDTYHQILNSGPLGNRTVVNISRTTYNGSIGQSPLGSPPPMHRPQRQASSFTLRPASIAPSGPSRKGSSVRPLPSLPDRHPAALLNLHNAEPGRRDGEVSAKSQNAQAPSVPLHRDSPAKTSPSLPEGHEAALLNLLNSDSHRKDGEASAKTQNAQAPSVPLRRDSRAGGSPNPEAHQAGLLDLLNSGPGRSDGELSAKRQNALVVGNAAELSARRSPGPTDKNEAINHEPRQSAQNISILDPVRSADLAASVDPGAKPVTLPVSTKTSHLARKRARLARDRAASPQGLEVQKRSVKPVTILQRPSGVKPQASPFLHSQASPVLHNTVGTVQQRPPEVKPHALPLLHDTAGSVQPKAEKEFKPQILRRPTQTPYDSSTVIVKSGKDIQESQDSIPKPSNKGLLSLFTKPEPAPLPRDHNAPTPSPLVIPAAEKALPLDPQSAQAARSRIGSMASVMSDRTAKGGERSKAGSPVTPMWNGGLG